MPDPDDADVAGRVRPYHAHADGTEHMHPGGGDPHYHAGTARPPTERELALEGALGFAAALARAYALLVGIHRGALLEACPAAPRRYLEAALERADRIPDAVQHPAPGEPGSRLVPLPDSWPSIGDPAEVTDLAPCAWRAFPVLVALPAVAPAEEVAEVTQAALEAAGLAALELLERRARDN